MLRKFFIFLIFGSIIGALVYGYLYYGLVALYDTQTPKVTHLYLVKKPEKDTTFFYNHIDKKSFNREIKRLQKTSGHLPWHLKYEWVVSNQIYEMTLDNRAKGEN